MSSRNQMTGVEAKRIRLLLVDDHFFVRSGLTSSLEVESDLEIVAEAESVHEAVERYCQTVPDVILLDANLPDGHGLTALSRIQAKFPGVHALMLSAEDSEEAVYRAMQAGACGYLSKMTPREQLLEAIRKVAKGETFLPPELEAKYERRCQQKDLSERELDVLRRVAKGCPNKVIGEQLGIAEVTVKVHLRRMFEKLGAQDRTSAATIALRRGLISLD
tara:strand:- start:7046 stop:7702 length:657 start_codon:yes stop_codon:yes gene_type:complete